MLLKKATPSRRIAKRLFREREFRDGWMATFAAYRRTFPKHTLKGVGCSKRIVNRLFHPLSLRGPPMLCQGCSHRDLFDAVVQAMSLYPQRHVFGDIGCYTLGALSPYNAISTCVDMGASITMAKGAADAGLFRQLPDWRLHLHALGNYGIARCRER